MKSFLKCGVVALLMLYPSFSGAITVTNSFELTDKAYDFNNSISYCQGLGSGWDLVTSRSYWTGVNGFNRTGFVKDVASTLNGYQCGYESSWPEDWKAVVFDAASNCVGDVPKSSAFLGICYGQKCTHISGFNSWSACNTSTGKETGLNPNITTIYSSTCTDAASTRNCGVCNPITVTTATATAPVNLCNFGTGTAPVISGNNWNWVCDTSSVDTNCSAPLLVNGQCGTRNKIYPSAVTGWGVDTACAKGTPSPAVSVFPTPGTVVSWSCTGINTGTTSNCSAGRKFPDPTVDLKINSSDGPVSVNRDTGSLSMIWNSSASSCTKSGVTWGSGALTPTSGSATLSPIASGPYPRSDVYSINCYNTNGNTTLDSAHVVDNVTVNISCTAGDVWSGCPKECGLASETESGTRTYANCTTLNLGTRSCNYKPCAVSSEWTEVRP